MTGAAAAIEGAAPSHHCAGREPGARACPGRRMVRRSLPWRCSCGRGALADAGLGRGWTEMKLRYGSFLVVAAGLALACLVTPAHAGPQLDAAPYVVEVASDPPVIPMGRAKLR